MAEVTQETLKELQARVKALQGTRDEVLGTFRVQQSKRDEAYAKLRELGVEDADKLTSKELQALADQKKAELAVKLEELKDQLAKGEQLITEYQELQEN